MLFHILLIKHLSTIVINTIQRNMKEKIVYITFSHKMYNSALRCFF